MPSLCVKAYVNVDFTTNCTWNNNCRQLTSDAAFWDAQYENNLADIAATRREQLRHSRNSKGPRLSVARYFNFVGQQYHARSLITKISLEESAARNNLQRYIHIYVYIYIYIYIYTLYTY